MHFVRTDKTTHFQRVFQQLKKYGFLLESDPQLPSVCSLINGGPSKSSWWSHPMAQVIFTVNEELEDHQDVLITKLVTGKVTFVHRSLWPELNAIGTSREDWQMNKLSDPARLLLQSIDERGSVMTNELSPLGPGKVRVGDVARELEKSLLIIAAQIHTPSGAHAKVLETWAHWAERIGFKSAKVIVSAAKKAWEERLLKLNQEFDAAAKLPWQRSS